MAARAGDEPTTLRLKAIDSTIVPPRPTIVFMVPYLRYVWAVGAQDLYLLHKPAPGRDLQSAQTL